MLTRNASDLSRKCMKILCTSGISNHNESRLQSTTSNQIRDASKFSNHSNASLNEQDAVNPDFVNRNPRNLEKMCLAMKPRGYQLEYLYQPYWHKVILEKSDRNTSAYIQHFTGGKVVLASTREWAIKKLLFSSTDVAAAENVGIVLGQRALESGILHVSLIFSQEQLNSNKVKAFLRGLEEGGLALNESFRRFPLRFFD